MAKRNRQPKAIGLSSLGDINTNVILPSNPGYILNNIIADEPKEIQIEPKEIQIEPKEIQSDNIVLQTDNISNVVINKFKNLGINMTNSNIKLEINDNKGECLRLSNKIDNSFVDFNVKNNGILTITPKDKTILIHSDNKINIGIPLTLLNYPKIVSENNLGVGLNFDLKNNIDIIKTFGTINIIGDNVTNTKENSNLYIDLLNNGNINKKVLSLSSKGILQVTRLVEPSDERIKKDIILTDIKDSYNKIMKIKVKDYKYKDDTENKIYSGVIAQELKKIIPNAVNIDDNGVFKDFHTVSTREVLYHIIGAIQHIELQKK
jgi:hypothetical protein